MNPIVLQSARDFCTPPPVPVPVSVLLLPAPKPRLMLSAPKIAGYLPAPTTLTVVAKAPVRRVVVAEIANPLLLIDIYKDPDAWLDEFDRIYGPSQTIEEMDAEIEAKYPGWIRLKESWS